MVGLMPPEKMNHYDIGAALGHNASHEKRGHRLVHRDQCVRRIIGITDSTRALFHDTTGNFIFYKLFRPTLGVALQIRSESHPASLILPS